MTKIMFSVSQFPNDIIKLDEILKNDDWIRRVLSTLDVKYEVVTGTLSKAKMPNLDVDVLRLPFTPTSLLEDHTMARAKGTVAYTPGRDVGVGMNTIHFYGEEQLLVNTMTDTFRRLSANYDGPIVNNLKTILSHYGKNI